VLIVEQNVRQVLQIVDRAYLLEAGRIRGEGSAASMLQSDQIRRAYVGL
jgi:branched-chain amino acid transport system ATP-binding protein